MILKINGQNFEFCHINLEKKKDRDRNILYCTSAHLPTVSTYSSPPPPSVQLWTHLTLPFAVESAGYHDILKQNTNPTHNTLRTALRIPSLHHITLIAHVAITVLGLMSF